MSSRVYLFYWSTFWGQAQVSTLDERSPKTPHQDPHQHNTVHVDLPDETLRTIKNVVLAGEGLLKTRLSVLTTQNGGGDGNGTFWRKPAAQLWRGLSQVVITGKAVVKTFIASPGSRTERQDVSSENKDATLIQKLQDMLTAVLDTKKIISQLEKQKKEAEFRD